MKLRKPKEESVHKQVVQYLKLQYKNIIFRSDAGGIKLSIGAATKMAALNSYRAYPDIFIAFPKKGFSGLFIEIKRSKSEVYLKDGITLKKDEHVREQQDMLIRLMCLGYKAEFGCGFEDCKRIIDGYLL